MKVRPNTIQAKVLNYLKTGHSLDNAKSMALFGSIRLSGAIHGLRDKNYVIKTETFKGPEGNTLSFYRYQGELAIGSKVLIARGCYAGSKGKVVDNTSYYGEVKVETPYGYRWVDKVDVELLNA